MTEYSDFSLGNKKNGIKINLDEITGGVKSGAVDKDLYSIFKGIVNTDNNDILDKDEIDAFIAEIKTYAKDNNFFVAEAAKYLKAKNLKDISPEKLFSFISSLSQASANISESSVITDSEGKKTFFIKYKDNSEETIYSDKTSKIELYGADNEFITRNLDASGKKISETVLYDDKSKRTTVYENNLPHEETYEKDGTFTIIKYESGVKKSKSVKSGETLQNFEYINGEEKPVYSKKFENKKWIEETITYNADGKITKSVSSVNPQNSDRNEITTTDYEYHANGQLAKLSQAKSEKCPGAEYSSSITKTFDESGKRLKLTSVRGYYFDDLEPSSYTEEINYDNNGNIVGYAPKNSTLDSILKDLKIEKDSELYEKFVELNKTSIKSFGSKKVKGFDVGAKIIIPGEVEENAMRYVNVKPKEEKESYMQDYMGNADVQAVPTTSITVPEDTTWWKLAKQNLIDLGNKNPTQAQIAENMNLLVTLNGVSAYNINNPITKGMSVVVRAKESANIPEMYRLETYNIETLKKTYPADKYQIKRTRVNEKNNEWGENQNPIWAYHVFDKSSGKEVLSVTPKIDSFGTREDLSAVYFDDTGKKYREISFANIYDNTVTEKVYHNGVEYNSTYTDGKQTSLTYIDPKTKRIVEIHDPSSPNKKIFIKKNKLDIEQVQYYKNGKLYQKYTPLNSIYYNPDGTEAYRIKWKQGCNHLELDYPAVKDFCKYLRNGNTAELQKILKIVNKDNYKMFMLAYTQNYEKDFFEEIKNSKIGNAEKNQILQKFRDFTNDEFKITTPHRISQNLNGSDKYSIDLKGDILTVKNLKTGKVSKIDFNNILSECSEFEKARFKKLITELMPGGVLEDMAIEVRKLKVMPKYNDDYASDDMETAGHYQGLNDYIYIRAAEVYGMEDNDNLSITSEITDDELIETLIHEIGHAVDFNGYVLNTPSSALGQFYAAFKRELENYEKSGKDVFNPNDKNFKVNSEYTFNDKTKQIEKNSNSAYATRNNKEMFAECYTLIMLGDCSSKEHIEKYFPETLKAAKQLLAEIRMKSPAERQHPYHL